jgi:hypothetical protein
MNSRAERVEESRVHLGSYSVFIGENVDPF